MASHRALGGVGWRSKPPEGDGGPAEPPERRRAARRGHPERSAAWVPVEVTVLNRQRRVRVNTGWLAKIARRVLERVDPRSTREVGVVLVTDARIRTLNRRYRGVDAATDVLAFPLGHPAHLGDVVISVETARRQAGGPVAKYGDAQHDGDLRPELARLLIHGLLHLLGYDHASRGPRRRSKRLAAEARRMRRLEVTLRRIETARRQDVIG